MIEIIDTHLHTWDLQKFSYYWLQNDQTVLSRSYLLPEIFPEFAASGIKKAIVVQANNQLEETDWLLKLAAVYPQISGVVVWLPLEDPAATERLLTKYINDPCFVGVRHQIHDESDHNWLLKPQIMESMTLLAESGVPYDLVGVKPAHIIASIRLAERLPMLKMVFDHLNQPPIATGQRFGRWGELMKEAASLPNMYAKISGLGATCRKGPNWDYQDILPYLEYAVELFGADRLFCGSDWPVSVLSGSYAYTWLQYRKALDELLNFSEQKLVYGLNARKFYSLKD